jgi:hypothetical protein
VNIQRIDKLWIPIIIEELTYGCESKNALIRNSALEAISYVILEVFDVKVKADPQIIGEVPFETTNQEIEILTISTEKSAWKYPAWQVTVLNQLLGKFDH